MKVLIVDDHALFRQGLAMVLSNLYSDIEIAEAGGADLALELCTSSNAFDIVLLDLAMEGMNGFEALHLLGESLPGVPIVIVSASENPAHIRTAFQAGAKGYIVKTSSAQVLKPALQLVLSGERYVPQVALGTEEDIVAAASNNGGLVASPNNGSRPFANGDSTPNALTARQQEVLLQMARGQSNKEIARNLGMLEGTAKVHVKTIFQKLGVKNRTMAVVMGVRLGCIPQGMFMETPRGGTPHGSGPSLGDPYP